MPQKWELEARLREFANLGRANKQPPRW